MKYKILLVGNNKTLIDDLFNKSTDRFEYQSTSARYEDIICHLKYFQPDGFLYCLNHEAPDSFRKMPDLKKAPETGKTAFFTIGTRAECDTYTRTAPGIVDMVLEKPMNISTMEDRMEAYFVNLLTPQIVPPPIAPEPAPVAETSVNTAPAAAAPQPAANAPKPQAVSPQPQTGSPAQASAPTPAAPAASSAAPAPEPAVNKQAANKPAPAMPNFTEDPNDALLLELTEHVDAASKLIDSVSGLPSMEPSEEENPARRKHVLVVDDDSRMLKIIKRHLADKYDVATALNGRLALKFLESKKTDLILLDYEMPLENGPTILKKLRDNPFTHDIPVIFLTGISEREKIEKALVLKPQGYLLKPIDHIKLLSTISKLIG